MYHVRCTKYWFALFLHWFLKKIITNTGGMITLKRQIDQEKSSEEDPFFYGVSIEREHDPEVIVGGHALFRDPGRPFADPTDHGGTLPDMKDLGIHRRAFDPVKDLPSGVQGLKMRFQGSMFLDQAEQILGHVKDLHLADEEAGMFLEGKDLLPFPVEEIERECVSLAESGKVRDRSILRGRVIDFFF